VNGNKTAILHYTAPPVVGGVEVVIQEHARVFTEAGFPVTVIAGRGDAAALAAGAELILVPEMDSQQPRVQEQNSALTRGTQPSDFEELVAQFVGTLSPLLREFDNLILHNLFTKHFNLALTAALYRLLDDGSIRNCIAWCHDFTWTSENSRGKVHPGYPWDLLRTYRADVTYVVVSEQRRKTLAGLFGCSQDRIRVIYNGVNPHELLGLSSEGNRLVHRLGLLEADLVLLMPVRVTQAKNIEFAFRTLAALKENDIRAKLIVTGPPDPHDARSMDYFQSLQALRSELNIEREARFVFESGPDLNEPYTIDSGVVGDLFRVSDMMFMPSHREGFGMPVLEAGLVGAAVLSSHVPAAVEIGGRDVILFDPQESPENAAGLVRDWMRSSSTYRLRRRVRQEYTWRSIFRRDILPILDAGQ
jgi:glycosyltransferase involved in cell wall biosynthesis